MNGVIKYAIRKRFYISLVLFLAPVFNACLGLYLGLLGKGAMVFLVSCSFMFFILVVQFLYGRTMTFGGATYRNDNSRGRVFLLFLLFFLYMAVQVLAYFVK